MKSYDEVLMGDMEEVLTRTEDLGLGGHYDFVVGHYDFVVDNGGNKVGKALWWWVMLRIWGVRKRFELFLDSCCESSPISKCIND